MALNWRPVKSFHAHRLETRTHAHSQQGLYQRKRTWHNKRVIAGFFVEFLGHLANQLCMLHRRVHLRGDGSFATYLKPSKRRPINGLWQILTRCISIVKGRLDEWYVSMVFKSWATTSIKGWACPSVCPSRVIIFDRKWAEKDCGD